MSFPMGKSPGPVARRERAWHPHPCTRAFGWGWGVEVMGIPSKVDRKARGKPAFGAQPSTGPGAQPTSVPLLMPRPPVAPSMPSGLSTPEFLLLLLHKAGGTAGRCQIRLCPLASPS